jgi:PiT family inorganic phosphate transporter
VGSIIGVGLARGIVALNLNIISSIIKSWLLTVPLTAGLTMVIFSITRYLFFH